MIIIYRPEDGEEQHWDLADVKATFAEARAAERAGGFKWAQVQEELAQGNIDALQAAVWVLRKRSEPTLLFSDLDDLPVDAIDVDFAPAEKAIMRAQLEGDPTMSEEARQMALEMLGAADTEPAGSEGEAPAPKDGTE
ncbi:hypothetical protein [Streptomyces sp. NPDC055058]